MLRQIFQIKKRGIKELIRKAIRLISLIFISFMYVFFFPILILMLLFIRILKPILHIRFGCIRSDVLGHFVFNTSYYLISKDIDDRKTVLLKTSTFPYLITKDIDNRKTIDLFFLSNKNVPNLFFLTLVKRNFNIFPLIKYFYYTNNYIFGENSHSVDIVDKIKNVDLKNLFNKYQNKLQFNNSESREGKLFLQSLGINNNEKYICLIVRDSAYKNDHKEIHFRDVDWSYHDYRDSDINNYNQSILYLANKGYKIFRMGKKVKNKLNVHHKNVFDYANSEYRSDFLDIWLMANCFFCISTATGLDEVANSYGKPIVFVNHLPVGDCRPGPLEFIELFKKLRFKSSKKFLSINDQIKNGSIFFFKSKQFEDKGIEIIDNNSEEILEAIVEMEKRLTGKWIQNENEKLLQDKFWHILKKWHYYKYYFGEKYPKINSKFLENNYKWFLK